MKYTKIITAMIAALMITGLASAQEYQEREKNSEDINIQVEQISSFDRIINNLFGDRSFSVALDQDELQPGDELTGSISGSIDAVEQHTSGGSCDGDQADLKVDVYSPDGYEGGEWVGPVSECTSQYIDYSYNLPSDATEGGWTVSAWYRHEDSTATANLGTDFGEDSFQVTTTSSGGSDDGTDDGGTDLIDSDGDGYYDNGQPYDSCPNEGDQGYGLDSNGCPKEAPSTPLSISISGDSDVEVQESASFTAQGDGDGRLSYTWYVDNNRVGTGRTLSHVFQDDGTYTVEAEISNSDGKETDTMRVNVNEVSPTAQIDLQKPSSKVKTGDKISLQGQQSEAGSYPIQKYSWSINGEYKSGREVAFVPEETGQANIELEVRDSQQNTDTASRTLTVVQSYAKPNLKIKAPGTVEIGETVTLDGSGSNAEAGLKTVEWDIQGRTQTGDSIETMFNTLGDKSVTATAVDKEGQETEKNFTIEVVEQKSILDQIANFFTSLFTR